MKNHKHQQKQDTSPVVHQRDKIKNLLNIKQFPWTEKQKQFIALALHKDTKIIFVSGPAGSSKSLLSTYVSLEMMNQKKISDIIYVRSAVESADNKLGYLPGALDDKIQYYGLPFIEKLDELLNRADVDKLEKENRISVFPVNYIRGVSWNTKSIIVDEAQNSSRKELITILTRLGKFSKCFVLADEMQSDLPDHKRGGYSHLVRSLGDEESKSQGIHHFQLEESDIMRSDLVAFIVKKLKQSTIA